LPSLRIRIQAHTASAIRADGEAQSGDSYVERLLKLIPAEVIGIYLVGIQVVGSDPENHVSLSIWTLACAIFVVIFRAILSTESPKLAVASDKQLRKWWKQFRKEAQWPAVVIATVSFLVWATALGYPIAPWLSATLNACSSADAICIGEEVGTLVLLLWTPLAAFLFSGERIGNLSPGKDGGGGPKPKEPSPKDALPPPAQRRVLQPDEREPPERLDRRPYESIALIHSYRSGHSRPSQMGTGWLATPFHIVTAAHVLKSGAKVRGWLRYDGEKDTWGAYFEARQLVLHPDYVNNANPSYDIAVIHLPKAIEIPALDIEESTSPPVGQLRCAGYPEDKGGLSLFEARGNSKEVVDNLLFHDIDTDEGQSGSPIWSGIARKVVAIHTGHGGDLHETLNRSVYLNAVVVAWIREQIE